ncbi:ESPR-type extended signal peptide-containing protein [Lysobacter arvi]|uniref:ESPR-type extended signal peptide-containing protein n=1 Tax=Lysobacter arvi TaxID=3038776 RepID=A0ABU1CIB8_9GAMM|nr:ESPR-type extended signal peptide-containing protein [Lysobacter arvi]MDR0184696.1 ESPR-type extended signal peptide-containing protein [Lysobacter arvi]
MNKIFRIVFNASTGRYVVASEMAKGRKKTAAAGAVLTAVVALAAVGNAQAKVVINAGTNESAVGCTYLQDENSPTLHTSSESTTCLVAGGTGESGQGNPGKRAVFYASDTVNGNEDSLNLGGYLDAWKLASFHSGLEMNSTKITGLAAGSIVDGSQDAINGDQVFDSNKAISAAFGGGSSVNASGFVSAPSYALVKANAIAGTTGAAADVGAGFDKVDAALGTLDTRVTNNTNSINSLQSTVNNLSANVLVEQSAAGANLTVGKATDGAAVDFNGTAGTRKLVGVSEGEVSATSKEAINGSQLYATNQDVAANTAAIGALDGRMDQAETDIAGLKTRADATDAAVAANTADIQKNASDISALDGRVDTAEANIAQNTSDIADLQTRADQTDAAVAQNTSDIADLKAHDVQADAAIAQNTSDIAALDNRVDQNTSDIAALDGRMGEAESSISNLDSRVTNVEGSVNNLNQQINNGEVGLVKQDADSRVITVAADKDGSEVNFAGTAGERKLSGVAEGEISASSKEAVNGSQLNATNERVAASEAAIDGLDSRVTKNEGDIASLDSRVTTNEGDISTLKSDVTNIDNRTTKNEGDIAQLDQRQTKTEGDVSDLRSGVDGLDGRVSTVESNVASLNEKLVKSNADVMNQSRSYTDSRVDELHREMDDRFSIQDERIDRMGAMSSAMSMMTASLGGLHTQNRAAVGTGFVNGEKALSVGYQRAMSDRANFSLGGAFTGDDRSVGAAVGIGW